MTAPVLRNAPCICGSGRRFKHCCGRDAGGTGDASVPAYPGWDAFAVDEKAALWATMQEALAAQKMAQLDTARVLYEEVIARAPLTFDAVHMLGVVLMQQGDLDAAEAMLMRALELMPGLRTIGHNLELLRHRKRDHEGLYSASIIMAVDALRLLQAARRLEIPHPATGLLPGATRGGETALHIVVPGDVLNAGANGAGDALASSGSHPGARLWTDPKDGVPMAALAGATTIDLAGDAVPRGGTLVVFGLNARSLTWLPGSPSRSIRSSSHWTPTTRRSTSTSSTAFPQRRLRAYGSSHAAWRSSPTSDCPARSTRFSAPRLPGATAPVRVSVHASGSSYRRCATARMPSAGRCSSGCAPVAPSCACSIRVRASRHVADDEEHLVSLVSDWTNWWDDLDLLFYWGAEGRMRQYDRLVFEALDTGMRVVADGFGDYGSRVAEVPECAQFFDPEQARAASSGCCTWRKWTSPEPRHPDDRPADERSFRLRRPMFWWLGRRRMPPRRRAARCLRGTGATSGACGVRIRRALGS